ncbi:MAG: hypothetical protein EBX41_00405 [Chitinophagia bacterium]|nr:hypothetical protein [Chitinophagia bacterium]
MISPPIYITFAAALLFTYYFISKATGFKKPFMIVAVLWMLLQIGVSFTAFYTRFEAMPPRFPLLILPPLAFLIYSLISPKGQHFLRSLDLKTLTLLHIVRIPVEIALWGLFLHKTIPEIMTFEGKNFDILSGLSATIIYYFAFVKNVVGKQVLLLWNVACLLLVINIVVIAILSTPTPFQKFGFEQPNIAVVYFPFLLLPAFIVPAVILAHVTAIKQLLSK